MKVSQIVGTAVSLAVAAVVTYGAIRLGGLVKREVQDGMKVNAFVATFETIVSHHKDGGKDTWAEDALAEIEAKWAEQKDTLSKETNWRRYTLHVKTMAVAVITRFKTKTDTQAEAEVAE